MNIKPSIAAIALLAASHSHAAFLSGNDLLTRINSDDGVLQGVALGYVIGVHDTSHSALHCSPAGISAGQVRDMVKIWLRDRPATRHLAADGLITDMLQAVWPCPNSKGGKTL